MLVGTGTGIYETKDGAASWELMNGTEEFGAISFAETTSGGKQYISANHGSSISSIPVAGGLWQTAKTPNNPNNIGQLSTVTTAGKTEIVMCIAGGVMYGAFDTPTSIQWTGPLNYTQNVYETWTGFQPLEGDEPGQPHQTYISELYSRTDSCHLLPTWSR